MHPQRFGKDYAVKQVTDLYVKPLNKWCGYKDENILISEVDITHYGLVHFYNMTQFYLKVDEKSEFEIMKCLL